MNAKPALLESGSESGWGRVSDYFALTKPRVTSMVLVTTLVGFYLGDPTSPKFVTALNLLIGTALASGGTLALNQYIERDSDAVMVRTMHRPLPDHRLRPPEALWFGIVCATAGLLYLLLTVNPFCAAVTTAIAIIYLLAYTPLKRVSWSCFVIGAIPGALPPVSGWVAARDRLGIEPWILFTIMFLWQFPHTFAIAKMYREDFRRAGLWLLPLDRGDDERPENPLMVAASAALIVIGALPTILGFAGIPYLAVSTTLGLVMVFYSLALVMKPETRVAARRVMFASLIYLPIVLLAMTFDRI